MKEWWEIPRDSLQVGEQLGSGAFGEVKKGFLTKGDETIMCAIKMLKRECIMRKSYGYGYGCGYSCDYGFCYSLGIRVRVRVRDE